MRIPTVAMLAPFLMTSIAIGQGGRIGAAPPPSARAIRFSTDEGTWVSLDVSPNGRAIAFELLGDIYIMPVGGGPARAILTGTAFQSQPRFSRDGASLTYVSDGDGSDNIWIAGPGGEHPRALTTMRRATMLSPEWSADGRSIYATVFEGRTADLWRFDVATGAGEKIVPNANGAASLLVSTPPPGPYGAHVTADGKWLYYASVTPRPYGSRNGASSRLVRRDLATGRDEPVTVEEPVAMKPVTSPNGALLAYGAQARGQTGLRVRDLATGSERWLRFPLQRNELEARASRDVLPNYAFTPDGSAVIIAFGGRIHRIDVATGGDAVIPFQADVALDVEERLNFPRRVSEGPVRARILQQPAVARDGRVAFSTLGRIYITGAPGTAPGRLTRTEHPREFMPAWSPDGAWVAFVTWGADGGALWKVRAAGGTPERLSTTPAFWADPAWTADGTQIVALRAPVSSARSQPLAIPSDAALVRIPAAGGAPVTIAAAAGARRPHFTADPARVLVSAPDGLVSVSLDGRDRRILARLAGARGGGPDGPSLVASPDGRFVAVHSGGRLVRIPLPQAGTPGGPVELSLSDGAAVEISRAAPTGFAWSPDASVLGWMTGSSWRVAPTVGGATRSIVLSAEVPRATSAGTIVLRGARAITMKGSEVIPAADIVITNNRITAIGSRGTVTVPPGARVIELAGKTIIPGIVDIHAHWQLRRELLEPEAPATYANLAFGVTTIRDPQTNPEIFGYADLADAGEMASPRIFSTGPGLFAETDFKSLDDARALITRYRDDYGTRLLKSYQVGNRQQRQWVVQASRELGMMPTTEGGADTKMNLTHAMDGFSGNEHALPTAPIYQDVIQLLARSGITYTPTLLVSFGGALPIFRMLAGERPFDDPKLRRFFPEDDLFQRTATRLLAFPPEDYNDKETSAGAAAVLAAGGRVALGGHGEMQGMQVHWEMRLLASGGMAPHDILRVATLNGAEAIGLAQDIGSLEVGKLADLVVLSANPLSDIRATSAIDQVMKDGVLYRGATLDRVWPQPAPLATPWWNAPANAASAFSPDAVDAVVRDEMDKQRIPGVGVAVLRGNTVLVAKGFGFANLEHQVPVGPETMFESGSMGKMFTAAGIMSLVEAGKLSPDSSVRVYLPDAPPSWQAITIRHLLSHTSGIPDYTSDSFDYRKDYTEADLARLAYGLTLEFPAGTRWNYSNTGYVVLGVVLSKLGGRPYWETLREKIFTPAGMPTVRIISESDIVPHRASGYLPTADGWRHQDWVAPKTNTTADGSLLISINDLVAWARVVRARGILSVDSWNRMQSPVRLNSGRTHPYGHGWFIDQLNGARVVQHGGSWQGFRTQFTRFEGSDLTVIVLTNSGAANPAIIASRIGAALDAALTPPALPTSSIAGEDAKVTAYVRDVLLSTARGELKVADFEFVRATVVPRMGAAYARMLAPLGAIDRMDLLARGEEGDDHTFTYRVRCANGVITATVKIGPGGRLTGLQLAPASP